MSSERERTVERAAALLSALIEPADAVAGAVIGALGLEETASWALQAPYDTLDPRLRPAVTRWRHRARQLDVDELLARLRHVGGQLLHREHPAWPAALRDLGATEPPALWVRGDPQALTVAGLAVVGSRAATRYGVQVAGEIAYAAAQDGWSVISGGAYGIDAAAHRAALAADGLTVALLAGGVDRLYPAGNTELLLRVAARGAVVSEVPPGAQPSRHRFLDRNRLIAALGRATVVVEAAERSGALSTANHAGRLMRPVAAVPGPVTVASSAGCHSLIRDGAAVLVTGYAQVRELASPAGQGLAEPAPRTIGLLDDLPPDASRVLDAMPARAGTEVSHLASVAGLTVSETQAALGLLQLGGKVSCVQGRWKRV